MHRLEAGGMLTKQINCPGADIRQRPSERAYASTGMRFLTVVVHKLPEAMEACRTGGGRVGHEPSCYEGGVYYAFVADPDGNDIELAGIRSSAPGVQSRRNRSDIAIGFGNRSTMM
jgi:predicted enzyme related to lactoylglutathione lyase